MQTALCGKIKERKGKWLIGAKTQNVLHLSIVVTQHKARQRRVIVMAYQLWVRRVGTRACKARNLADSFTAR